MQITTCEHARAGYDYISMYTSANGGGGGINCLHKQATVKLDTLTIRPT